MRDGEVDTRIRVTREQKTFIDEISEQEGMEPNQLLQYVVDDFLLQLHKKGYKFKTPALGSWLNNYVRSPSFKRKRRARQNG